MSCEGCIYDSKKAGCSFDYPCNSTARPIRKLVRDEDVNKKKKRQAREVRQEALAVIANS